MESPRRKTAGAPKFRGPRRCPGSPWCCIAAAFPMEANQGAPGSGFSDLGDLERKSALASSKPRRNLVIVTIFRHHLFVTGVSSCHFSDPAAPLNPLLRISLQNSKPVRGFGIENAIS